MMRREWRDDITYKEISAHFEKTVDRRMVSDLIEWGELPAEVPPWGQGRP